jgi:hypothetical protein
LAEGIVTQGAPAAITSIVLILAVGAVGVLHTLVPDHWLPIALVARQHGWTRAQTARAAFGAGTGHVLSTLVIGLAVWAAGFAFAMRFGSILGVISSVALIGFGAWIAVGSYLEMRREGQMHTDHSTAYVGHSHGHSHAHGDADFSDHDVIETAADVSGSAGGDTAVLDAHRHLHRHADGLTHAHLHKHTGAESLETSVDAQGEAPLHVHEHKATGRTALLLILGSSPMVEGIPAFFAAARYGIGVIVVMSIVFAAATIATYVVLCVLSAERLQVVSIGPLERYGEVLSGGFIALVGVAFLLWPLL